MAFIEVHQALFTHRKTLKLSRLLGLDRWSTIGRLVALWQWALDNTPEGDLGDDFADYAGEVMGWQDDPEVLINAMVRAGFLDQDEHGHYLIHDWMDYAGQLIIKRRADAERKRADRANKAAAQDVQRMSNGHPDDGAGTVPNTTVAYPTSPNTTGESVSNPPQARARENGHAPTPTPTPTPVSTPEPPKPRPSIAPRMASAQMMPSGPGWEQPPSADAQSTEVPPARGDSPPALYAAYRAETGQPPGTRAEQTEALRWLRELTQMGVSGRELRRRIAIYRAKFDRNRETGEAIPVSPRAVVRNWSKLAQEEAHHGAGTTQATAAVRAAEAPDRAERDAKRERERNAALAGVFRDLLAEDDPPAGAHAAQPRPAAHPGAAARRAGVAAPGL